jgi:hypothetical protein
MAPLSGVCLMLTDGSSFVLNSFCCVFYFFFSSLIFSSSLYSDITRNLHHLLSTKAQPGIYNSPYLAMPEAYGEPIESHLRRVRPAKSQPREVAPTEPAVKKGFSGRLCFFFFFFFFF